MTEANLKPESTASTAEPRSARTMQRFVLLLVVPLIAAVIVGVIYLLGGRYVETDNAYVKAEKVSVSAEVAGKITVVLVRENEVVVAGQALFRINAAPFQVAVAKAEADLAQVRTEIAVMKAGYREKQAEIALARTRQIFAQKDQQRQADLVAKHFVAATRFDEAKQGVDLARQELGVLQQDLNRVVESLGGSMEIPVEKHPSYLAAAAELEQAKLNLTRSEVRAPSAGTVSKPPKIGQYVTAGSMAMTLVVSGNIWIEANFSETELTYMHPGQQVRIHIDTFPKAVWSGVVDSLSPGTGAEFSVIPAQNATGNWVKIAQRVPVRIKVNDAPQLPQLLAGLSAVVAVDTGHRRRLLGVTL